MAWVKRNLYFLIGAAVAIALLGLAGYYFYSKWTLNKENDEKLTAAYEDLKRIVNTPLGPGNDQVNNIQRAREEEEKARAMIQKLRAHFVPIPPIPNPPNGGITGVDFYGALSGAINRLTREAANAGVKIQANYSFSFEAERPQVVFEPGSLGPLSEQLGDVSTICGVLFKAKINSLTSLRRPRVSQYDNSGATDYLDVPAVTNEFAVLVPYEARFECFSAELGEVLAGFGNLPNGIIVKVVNVEPNSTVAPTAGVGAAPAPVYQYATVQPQFAGQLNNPYGGAANRYRNPYTLPGNPYNRNPYSSPYQVQPAVTAPPARSTNTVLDERPLTVTMVLNIVKLLPRK